jgi:hypothetical protein
MASAVIGRPESQESAARTIFEIDATPDQVVDRVLRLAETPGVASRLGLSPRRTVRVTVDENWIEAWIAGPTPTRYGAVHYSWKPVFRGTISRHGDGSVVAGEVRPRRWVDLVVGTVLGALALGSLLALPPAIGMLLVGDDAGVVRLLISLFGLAIVAIVAGIRLTVIRKLVDQDRADLIRLLDSAVHDAPP